MADGRIAVRLEGVDGDDIEVVEVSVQPGAVVSAGDVLLELATDKANMDVTAPQDGTVEEVLVAEGDIVVPGQAFVVLVPR